jgi:hypothetical protein
MALSFSGRLTSLVSRNDGLAEGARTIGQQPERCERVVVSKAEKSEPPRQMEVNRTRRPRRGRTSAQRQRHVRKIRSQQRTSPKMIFIHDHTHNSNSWSRELTHSNVTQPSLKGSDLKTSAVDITRSSLGNFWTTSTAALTLLRSPRPSTYSQCSTSSVRRPSVYYIVHGLVAATVAFCAFRPTTANARVLSKPWRPKYSVDTSLSRLGCS